ncbi:MAG: DUF2062 domain-containing protein [Proteobacteria bacterium]|nr:DUF2062 domain-containing protein [Pseudomonadota bacterium]
MFKRRAYQPVHHRVGDLIWPRIGFRRSATYIWHRVGRLHGTPHSIAGGFATGAAVSFTPFVGGHFVLAVLISWATRSNIVAGLMGTAVGNPWTFPFIWLWVYELGRGMGAGEGRQVKPDALAIIVDLPGVIGRALLSFDVDWNYLDNLWAVLWPMMVGSIPTFILVWLTSYLVLKPLVATYQANRIMRLRRKQGKAREAARLKAREMTGMMGVSSPESAKRNR